MTTMPMSAQLLRIRIARLKRLLKELDRHEREMKAAIFEIDQLKQGSQVK